MAAFSGVLNVDIIGLGELRVVVHGVEQSHLLYVLSIHQQGSAWTVHRETCTRFYTFFFASNFLSTKGKKNVCRVDPRYVTGKH